MSKYDRWARAGLTAFGALLVVSGYRPLIAAGIYLLAMCLYITIDRCAK